ncbi:hypothetical protein BC332_27821 [Capsicum chinense]|nr:hypothetical protein BC332_27821 [Capsicum chinense]
MQYDGATYLTGDFVVKSAMGKSFDAFRKILREQKLDAYFRDSCFGKYLNLPEDNNARFQMKMVYELLKRRFMYENKDKIDEVWINYCIMPVCFSWKEFVIVTGLKCYPPSQVIPILTQKKHPAHAKRAKASRVIVTNCYPWGYEGFKMTVKYLLTPLAPKTVNLYGFPWAFMVWAFKVIPYLRQQVNYQEGVFGPRILRWLLAKTDKNTKFLDLLNPLKDTIVHPSLVPTNQELKMSFFLTLRSVQTLSDPKVIDRIKIKLFGATTIIRKIILEGGLVVVDGLSSDGAVGGGSGAVVGANDAPLIKKLLLNNIDNMLLFLWKYGEQKAQKPYVIKNNDPRRAKPNSVAPDEEQLVHTE